MAIDVGGSVVVVGTVVLAAAVGAGPSAGVAPALAVAAHVLAAVGAAGGWGRGSRLDPLFHEVAVHVRLDCGPDLVVFEQFGYCVDVRSDEAVLVHGPAGR